MTKMIFLISYILLFSYSFGQKAIYALYLHGSYTDSDWEQLEFIVPTGSEKADIYYNYAQSKKGKIKLEKKERLEIGGNIIFKSDGTITSEDWYWAEDDPRCIPSLSKKVKYRLEYNILTKTY